MVTGAGQEERNTRGRSVGKLGPRYTYRRLPVSRTDKPISRGNPAGFPGARWGPSGLKNQIHWCHFMGATPLSGGLIPLLPRPRFRLRCRTGFCSFGICGRALLDRRLRFLLFPFLTLVWHIAASPTYPASSSSPDTSPPAQRTSRAPLGVPDGSDASGHRAASGGVACRQDQPYERLQTSRN
jgi:hypothetical protein